MAVLKDLIVHGASRFLNGASFNTINAESIGANQGIFNKLIATTLDAKEATIDNLTAQNATIVGLLDVQGELHTNSWTNANIANIGGSFYISPTVEPTDGTTTISITRNSATSWTVSAAGTFATDFVKSGTATSGVAWPANSLVLITGDVIIGDMVYPLGTLKGTLNAAVTATAASTSKTITITGVTDAQNNNAPSVLQELYEINSSTNISNAPFKKGKISLYKLGSNPIGILMTSMGTNSNSLMDIYGGVSTTPNVRIGHLGALNSYTDSAGNTRQPTGWGIYTDNGYFKGVVVADSGSIGHFTIDSNSIYSGSHSAYNSNNAGIFLGRPSSSSSDYYIAGGPQALWYLKSDGSAKIGAMTLSSAGVLAVPAANISGTLTASQVDVSGIITAGSIVTNTLTGGTFNTADYIRVSTQASSSLTIGTSGAKTDWRIIAGKTFGVDKSGNLYATSANITGALTATSLTINSGASISGDGANQILNSEIEVGGRNLLVGTAISITKTTTATSSYVTQSLYYTPSKVTLEELGLQAGDKITLSFDWKITSASTYGNARIEYYGTTSSNADAYITALVNPFATFSSTNTSGHFVTTVTLTDATIKTKRLLLRIDNSNLTLTISNLKLEKGNKATDWTPAPEDVNDSEYIAGTQTTSTRFWTGNTSVSELKDGLQITYWLPYATKSETAESKNITAAELNPTETITTAYSNTWLKLTLANGTTTDWIPCYYNGTSRLTTHYGANNIVRLTYKTNVGSIAAGWWSDANYNTNDVDRKRINNNVIVRENITQYCVAGYIIPSSGTAGYRKLISGSKIDLSYPIAYLSQANISGQSYAVASDGVTTNFYTAMPSVNLRNTKSSWTGTQYAMCYIKGTVSGNIFTVHSDIFTTTTPSIEDNFYYIPIGILYSTYQVNFDCKNQLYVYKNGAFGPVSIREASAAAKTATNFIAADTTNGIMVYDGQNGTQTYSSVNTGNIVITSTGMKVRSGQITLADYGTTITLGQETSGSLRTKIDSDTFWITNGTTDIAFIGNENKTVTDTFVSDGSTLTYTLNSIWLSGGTFSPSSITGSKISGQNKISINSGTLPAAGETFTYTYTPSSAVTYYTMGTRNSSAGIGDYSFAEGKDVISSGLYAHAEGYQTEASGKQSHAEGNVTYAYGNYSHAEGLSTYTYGTSAHAEGNNTKARGYASHAEGENCKAKGDYSHAEGFYTEASESAHAEGFETKANGFYSHTQNRCTETDRTSQTVIGEFNAIDTADVTTQRDPDLAGNSNIHYGNYAFIVGNGLSDTARSNAFAVDWFGNAVCYPETISLEAYVASGILTTSGKQIMFSIPTGRVLPSNASISKITFSVSARVANANGTGYFCIKGSSGGTGTVAFDSSTSKTFYNANNVSKSLTSAMWTKSIQGGTNIYISWTGDADYFFSGSSTINNYTNNNPVVLYLSSIEVELTYS